MPPLTRRQALQLGASGALAVATGCTSTLLGRPKLSLTLLNRDDAFHRLYVQLHRADREEASEAFVFDAEYELPARDDSGVGVVHDEEIIPTYPYLVRSGVDGAVDTHYHFYPDCTGNDEPEERLYVEILSHEDGAEGDPDPRIRFGQNGCSDDAWSI